MYIAQSLTNVAPVASKQASQEHYIAKLTFNNKLTKILEVQTSQTNYKLLLT
jgi:hypothetical protein